MLLLPMLTILEAESITCETASLLIKTPTKGYCHCCCVLWDWCWARVLATRVFHFEAEIKNAFIKIVWNALKFYFEELQH